MLKKDDLFGAMVYYDAAYNDSNERRVGNDRSPLR